MKLLLLSTTRGNNNPQVTSQLKAWSGKTPKIGYIPSSPDPTQKYFDEVKAWFKNFIPEAEFGYLDIHNEKSWEKSDLDKFDLLYLSGGNTFNLIKALRASKAGELIKEIAETTDTPILGVSAGGIVLTPDIRSAETENNLGLTNFEGLSVISFGFYPHFDSEHPLKDDISHFIDLGIVSETYAIPEFSGISITESGLTYLGPVYRLTKERKHPERIDILSGEKE